MNEYREPVLVPGGPASDEEQEHSARRADDDQGDRRSDFRSYLDDPE